MNQKIEAIFLIGENISCIPVEKITMFNVGC